MKIGPPNYHFMPSDSFEVYKFIIHSSLSLTLNMSNENVVCAHGT